MTQTHYLFSGWEEFEEEFKANPKLFSKDSRKDAWARVVEEINSLRDGSLASQYQAEFYAMSSQPVRAVLKEFIGLK